MYTNITFEVLNIDLMNWYFQYQFILWTVLLTPVVTASILSLVWISLVFMSAFYLKAYRYYLIIIGYTFTPQCWGTARSTLAHLWDAQARFWYGYEIEGLENIPDDGPALFVFYHGAVPIDWYYLVLKTFTHKNRLICTVADRFLFKLPAVDDFMDCFQMYPATIDTCVDILKKGNLLGLAPGGLREALFGDETYPLIWGTRKGFAKVAMEAKVPIIPIFTENIREAFFTVRLGKKWLRGLYERIRVPVLYIFGGFPVKLRTIIGEPIQYDPEITPEELASKVADKLKSMIKQHQQLPGSVSRSMLQRFRHLFKKETVKYA